MVRQHRDAVIVQTSDHAMRQPRTFPAARQAVSLVLDGPVGADNLTEPRFRGILICAAVTVLRPLVWRYVANVCNVRLNLGHLVPSYHLRRYGNARPWFGARWWCVVVGWALERRLAVIRQSLPHPLDAPGPRSLHHEPLVELVEHTDVRPRAAFKYPLAHGIHASVERLQFELR